MRKIQYYANLGIQSALIAWATFMVAADPWPKYVAGILFVQLALGVYQMSASLWSIAFHRPRTRGMRAHFILSTIYLISLATLGAVEVEKNVLRLYLILPSWMLGIYYYYLSWNIRVGNNKRSKFLPNLGF